MRHILDVLPQSDIDWIIGVIGVALIANVLGPVITVWWTRKMRRDISETRDQVGNTHQTNLRDDLDKVRDSVKEVGRQVELVAEHLDPVTGAIRTVQSDIGGLRSEIRGDRQATNDRIIALNARVHDLEHPPAP